MENKGLIRTLIRDTNLRQKPFLILANKQDLPSYDLQEFLELLSIESIANDYYTPIHIQLVSSKTRDGRKNINIGLNWLLGVIVSNFELLLNRQKFDKIDGKDNKWAVHSMDIVIRPKTAPR